jgi:hypothetical protein
MSGTVAPRAIFAALSAVDRMEAKVHEGVEAGGADQEDAAAIAAIPAIGAPEGYVFFAAKADAAIAAIACFDPDICFVDEFHGFFRIKKPRQRTRLLGSAPIAP